MSVNSIPNWLNIPLQFVREKILKPLANLSQRDRVIALIATTAISIFAISYFVFRKNTIRAKKLEQSSVSDANKKKPTKAKVFEVAKEKIGTEQSKETQPVKEKEVNLGDKSVAGNRDRIGAAAADTIDAAVERPKAEQAKKEDKAEQAKKEDKKEDKVEHAKKEDESELSKHEAEPAAESPKTEKSEVLVTPPRKSVLRGSVAARKSGAEEGQTSDASEYTDSLSGIAQPEEDVLKTPKAISELEKIQKELRDPNNILSCRKLIKALTAGHAPLSASESDSPKAEEVSSEASKELEGSARSCPFNPKDVTTTETGRQLIGDFLYLGTNNEYSGKGLVKYADESGFEEGEFDEKGLLQGEGQISNIDGKKIGVFVDGLLDGEGVEIIWDDVNNLILKGLFKKGRLHGEAVARHYNRNLEGTFIEGEIMIKGTFAEGVLVEGYFHHPEDKIVSVGTFMDDKLIQGKKTHPDKTVEEGSFSDGVLIRGTKTLADGTVEKIDIKKEKGGEATETAASSIDDTASTLGFL